MEKPKRVQITDEAVEKMVSAFRTKLHKAISKHGAGACWSLHEILGLVVEEQKEITDAIHQNDVPATREECLDLMVAGAWGVVSIDQEVVDGKW